MYDTRSIMMESRTFTKKENLILHICHICPYGVLNFLTSGTKTKPKGNQTLIPLQARLSRDSCSDANLPEGHQVSSWHHLV